MLLLFSTLVLCATFVPGDAQDVCAMARDEGVICSDRKNPPTQKFYFESRMGVCQPFMYNGCSGNGNRFDTAEKCKGSCANSAARGDNMVGTAKANATNSCPGGAAPFMVVKGVPAICRTVRDCMAGYGCSKGVCCPNKAEICKLNYDAGKFRTDGGHHVPMYYYNAAYKACMLFTYFGSAGNANNFATYNDCMDFCS